MRWVVVALCLLGCLEHELVPCGDELCPRGTVCRALSNPDEQYCATREQVRACEGVEEASACGDNGWCHDGVCLPITCGNSRIDRGEVCDDGNTVTGDGTCAGDCASDERCGNGAVDPVKMVGAGKELNEQCDDGNQASGDGCSSACRSEFASWSRIDPAPIPAIPGAGVAYDSLRRRFVLFGGGTVAQPNPKTYEWDGIAWTEVTTALGPNARTNHAIAYDAARHRVVVFGGHLGNDDFPFEDTWTWDGNHWTLEAPAVSPPGRTYSAMAYDSARQRTVLFGGFLGRSSLDEAANDTWEWDGATWAQISGAAPPARSRAFMTYDPRRGRIVLVGGDADAQPLLDTWEYDASGWRQVSAAGPADLDSIQSLTFDGNGVIAYTSNSSKTYAFDGATWAEKAATGPSSRSAIASAFDPHRGRVLMFGGYIGSTPTNETCEWSGTAWSLVSSPATPTPREAMATAYDERRGVTWMFGGAFSGVQLTNELWSFDGVSRWKRINAPNAPSARWVAAGAYDRINDRFVVFGGLDGGGSLADTHLWDGSVWTRATPVHVPPSRFGATMTYDARRNRIVLFGGVELANGITTMRGDVWEWDGADWIDVTPPVTPSTRAGAASTFDEARGYVLVLGGAQLEQNYQLLDDMWAFDGSTWHASTTPFPERWFTALFYDPLRRRSVVFGGTNVTGDYDDTWEWNGQVWQRMTTAQRPQPRSAHAMFRPRHGAGVIVHGGSEGDTVFSDLWRLGYDNGEPRELCMLSTVDNDGDSLAGCVDPDCWQRCTPQCPPGAACDPAAPRCGDGTCNPFLEDARLCPSDCPVTDAACGDAFCDPGESTATCPGDCP